MNPTEAYQLPSSWTWTHLGELVDHTRPITYGVVQPGEHDPAGIPLVRGSDFSGGWRPLSEYKRVSPDIEKTYSRARLKGGDLVITIKGAGVGGSAKVPPWLEGANISQTNARIAISPRHADADYVLSFLQSPFGEKCIQAATQGGAQPGLIFEGISQFKLPLPPLDEQRQIAGVLQAWDEALALQDRLITAKERRLRGLVADLVFGARRLGPVEASERDRQRWFLVPSDWRVTRIGDVATETGDRNGDGAVTEVLSCSKHRGFVRSLEYFGKQVFSADLTTYRTIRRNEFGFPANHVEEGSIGLQNIVDVGVVSPIYTVFAFDPDEVLPEYAFKVLKTEVYQRIFEASTSASVDRRGSLRWNEFALLPFPLPPLSEQHSIASVLRAAEDELSSEQARRGAIARQKRGLMQKLLTGAWRVPETVAMEAAE